VQTAGSQTDSSLQRLANLPSSPTVYITKQGSLKYLVQKVKVNRAKYYTQEGVEIHIQVLSQL
jgi:hypothetical protein